MAADWKTREAKRNWAKNNPDKVRAANKLWRQTFRHRYNQAAAARMRRYRAQRKLRNVSGSRP